MEESGLHQDAALESPTHEIDARLLEAYGRLSETFSRECEDLDWENTFRLLQEALRPLFGFEGMLPILLTSQSNALGLANLYRMYASDEDDPDAFEAIHLFHLCPFLDRALEAGEPICVGDFLTQEREAEPGPFEQVLIEREVRSLMIVPVGRPWHPDEEESMVTDVVGLLVFYHRSPGVFTEQTRRLADRLRPFLVTIFRNAHFFHEHQLRELHTEIIHDVSAEAIAQLPSSAQLYDRVVELIHDHFDFYDVAIFAVEWGEEMLHLTAHAGDYPYYRDLRYTQDLNTGILGHVARTGQPYVANDVHSDPIYVNAFPQEASVRSELALPIKIEADFVVAVLEIQSQTLGAFDRHDLEALEILCQLMGRILQSAQSFEEMRRLKEFNSQVLDTMPSAIVVLDHTFRVVYANEQFCTLQGDELVNILYRPIDAVCSPVLMEHGGLRELLEQLSTIEGCGYLSEVRMEDSPASRVVDIRVCKTWEEPPRYIMILQDVSARAHQLRQMEMLQTLGQALQRTLDLKTVVHKILTSVTAGPGFGLNRAVLFLLEQEGDRYVLEEFETVGPDSEEEAHRIWSQIPFAQLDEYLRQETLSESNVQIRSRYARIRVSKEEVERLSRWREPFTVHRDEPHPSRIVLSLREFSKADESVILPLIARDRLIGVILADNFITRKPINDRLLQTLGAFASQAALAISNAAAYTKLEEAFKELRAARSKLLENEKLAIIGQMAAHVAHEIRNPLVAIGGFARRIVKTCGDDETRRRAQVIVRESERLELILKDVMDFASPLSVNLAPTDLEQCVREMIDVLGDTAQEANVRIEVDAAPEMRPARADADRIKQVILNLAKNAIEAMPEGGTLTFSLRSEGDVAVLEIRDTGSGIREEDLAHLFDPFFTTKAYGSGLGLAVTKRIVEHHGGSIEARSRPNEGTTFIIRLPHDDIDASDD